MFYCFFSTVDMSVDVSEHTSSEREAQSQKNIILFVRCSCFLILLRLCEIMKDTRFCLLIIFPDLLRLRKSKNGGSIKQVFFI